MPDVAVRQINVNKPLSNEEKILLQALLNEKIKSSKFKFSKKSAYPVEVEGKLYHIQVSNSFITSENGSSLLFLENKKYQGKRAYEGNEGAAGKIKEVIAEVQLDDHGNLKIERDSDWLIKIADIKRLNEETEKENEQHSAFLEKYPSEKAPYVDLSKECSSHLSVHGNGSAFFGQVALRNRTFLAMKKVKGSSANKVLLRYNFDLKDSCTFVSDLKKAIEEELREKNLMHGDITTNNIIVVDIKQDKHFKIKFIDFGRSVSFEEEDKGKPELWKKDLYKIGYSIFQQAFINYLPYITTVKENGDLKKIEHKGFVYKQLEEKCKAATDEEEKRRISTQLEYFKDLRKNIDELIHSGSTADNLDACLERVAEINEAIEKGDFKETNEILEKRQLDDMITVLSANIHSLSGVLWYAEDNKKVEKLESYSMQLKTLKEENSSEKTTEKLQKAKGLFENFKVDFPKNSLEKDLEHMASFSLLAVFKRFMRLFAGDLQKESKKAEEECEAVRLQFGMA